MNLGLFLDLDHTVIKPKSGGTFPEDINDWEFITGVLPLIKRYVDKGYHIFIVTNQGGIAQGYMTREEFNAKAVTITEKLKSFGIPVSKWYISETLDKDDYFRKPNPGNAYKAALEFELSLRYSIMVGDMDSDNVFAKNAYIGTYYHIDKFLKLENNDKEELGKS